MAIDHVDHVRSHCFGVRECDYFILDWTLTTSLLIQTRQTLITAICHICLLLLLFSHYHYTLCNSLLHWILFCVLILHKIRSIIRVSSSFLLQQYEMEVGSSSSSLMPHVLKSVSLFWGEKLHLLPIFFLSGTPKPSTAHYQHRKQTFCIQQLRRETQNYFSSVVRHYALPCLLMWRIVSLLVLTTWPMHLTTEQMSVSLLGGYL